MHPTAAYIRNGQITNYELNKQEPHDKNYEIHKNKKP